MVTMQTCRCHQIHPSRYLPFSNISPLQKQNSQRFQIPHYTPTPISQTKSLEPLTQNLCNQQEFKQPQRSHNIHIFNTLSTLQIRSVSGFAFPKCDTDGKPYQVSKFRNVIQISKKTKSVSGF